MVGTRFTNLIQSLVCLFRRRRGHRSSLSLLFTPDLSQLVRRPIFHLHHIFLPCRLDSFPSSYGPYLPGVHQINLPTDPPQNILSTLNSFLVTGVVFLGFLFRRVDTLFFL